MTAFSFFGIIMTAEKPGNPPILLRLPPEIGMPLLKDSSKRKCSIQSLILEIVSAHYNTQSVAPTRGRPPKKKVDGN
jgi:hypothetical protein